MTPLTWSIAANTGGTVLALVLAALAFLRRDQRCRTTCTTAQACEQHTARAAADLARLVEMAEQHFAADLTPGPLRFEPPEAPAERTQPGGEPPMLCGDDRPVSGRHALADDTRHLPAFGDLHSAGGEHR